MKVAFAFALSLALQSAPLLHLPAQTERSANSAGPKAVRVLVVTDMEGLSGVADPRMVSNETRFAEYYAKGLERLHSDVNECIAGLLDGGATAVDVVDGHGSGRNLQASRLDPRAKLLPQNVRRDIYMSLATPDTYDAVIAVGMHDKPLSGGFMAHTRGAGLSPVLNGATLTETELIGYEFGLVDVPVIFVSGDDHLERDLARTMPWIVYVMVKHATGYASAELMPDKEVAVALRTGARRAVESLARMQPLKPITPISAGMLATFPQSLPPAGSPFSRLPGIEYRGDTVTFPARDYREAYDRMGALMGIAVRLGQGYILGLARARPDGERALQAVSDSLFDVLLPAFENGKWRPGTAAPGR